MPFIYKIQNKINQKVYIGKTLYSIQRRWNQHKQNAQRENLKNIPLYNAIRKYGIENFTISQVEKVNNESILSDREKYWIKYYDSYNTGYNATLGGDGSLLYDYDKIWKLWQEGLSIKQISKKIQCNDYVVRTVLDIHNISTTERKIRGYVDGNRKCKQTVEQIDLNTNQVIQIFSSISEAAKCINGDSSCISKACRGKLKTYKGYKWKYKNQPEKRKDFSAKKVNQIDLKTNKIIKTYNSLSDAAKAVNGDASSISKVCRGIQKSSKGFKWTYAN